MNRNKTKRIIIRSVLTALMSLSALIGNCAAQCSESGCVSTSMTPFGVVEDPEILYPEVFDYENQENGSIFEDDNAVDAEWLLEENENYYDAKIEISNSGEILNPYCELQNPSAGEAVYAEMVGEVNDTDHVLGPADAVFTIIDYGDFQCGACAEAFRTLIDYQAKHSDKVRIVFRSFPLDTHDLAVTAAAAAETAGRQGRYFEAADLLYTKQDAWSVLTEGNFVEWVKNNFAEIDGIDIDLLADDMQSDDIAVIIETGRNKAAESGLIEYTPTILLNYMPYGFYVNEADLDKWLDLTEYESALYPECPEFWIDLGKDYSALIETTAGTIEAELYPDSAPLGVAAFVKLAEDGWYDDMPLTAVIDSFAVQFGDRSGTGYLNCGFSFAHERTDFDAEPGLISLFHADGTGNSSIIVLWMDQVTYYADLLQYSGENLSDEEVLEQARILALSNINSQTVIGKITEEGMKTAEQLTEADRIIKISIEKE